MKQKRVLVVSPGVPHPSRGASTVLFFYYIRAIRRMGYQVLNLLLVEDSPKLANSVREFELAIGGGEGAFEVVPCAAKSFIVQSRFASRLNPASVAEAVRKIEGFDPDAVVCLDFLSARVLGEASISAGVPRAVWLGDLDFQTQWFHALYAFREIKSPTLRNRARLLTTWVRCKGIEALYRSVLKSFQLVIASSKSAERRLAEAGIQSVYLPYPWPEEKSDAPVTRPDRPTFLFLGNLVGLGSRSAFHFIVSEEFIAALESRWSRGGYRILITGTSEPPDWVKRELSRRPEFEYLGFVEDMVGLMRSVHAVIVPIDVPVGNRSRVVTAMANRTPVVAHRNVALGNPDLVDGDTCLLANEPASFVAAMASLVDKPELALRLVARAREAYDAGFAPSAACESLEKRIRTLLRE